MAGDDVLVRLAELESRVRQILDGMGRIEDTVNKLWRLQVGASEEAKGPFVGQSDLGAFVAANELGSADLVRGVWEDVISMKLRRILERHDMPPVEMNGKFVSVGSLKRIRTQVVGTELFAFSTPRRRKVFTAWIDSL